MTNDQNHEAGGESEFTLDDFRKMLRQTKQLMMNDAAPDDEIRRVAGIIESMPPAERRSPTGLVDRSRRRRIAAGAGVEPHIFDELIAQFDGVADMMKKIRKLR